jgi:hypothetical protein
VAFDLWLDITYNIDDNTFSAKTNIQEDKINDIVETFLYTQIGKGKDNREPIDRPVYHITIKLDLSFDTFSVSDDCGNCGLRDGILMAYIGSREKNEGRKKPL